jgi:hypothetical protein
MVDIADEELEWPTRSLQSSTRTMTTEETLRKASLLFHQIAGAHQTEKLLENDKLSAVTRAKLSENLRTPAQLVEMAADGFELCVMALAALGATDVAFHECVEADMEEW